MIPNKSTFVSTDEAERIRELLLNFRMQTVGLHFRDKDFVDFVECNTESTGAESHLASCNQCAARMEDFLLESDAIIAELEPTSDSWSSWIDFNTGHVSELATPESIQTSDAQTQEPATVRLLNACGVIEQECDYAIPSGEHTSTHFNTGRLCESETALDVLAGMIAERLSGVPVDVIVGCGWQMATLARRVVRKMNRGRVAFAHGYDEPILLSAIESTNRAVILTDVVVNGGLLSRIDQLLDRQGATVTARVALIDASQDGLTHPVPFESLCHIPIAVSKPADCILCKQAARIKYWNALSFAMSEIHCSARSLTEFLHEVPGAYELWDIVNSTGAFQHHHAEGRKHYKGFIDVAQLLTDGSVRTKLVSDLGEALATKAVRPDVIIVPALARAQLIAAMLIQHLKKRYAIRPVLVHAFAREGHWTMLPNAHNQLIGASALVVDSAAAHGETLDELCLAAADLGAIRVGGAVLISRLSEGHELVLEKRLGNGFTRAFNYPVPSQEVAEGTRHLCDNCAASDELQRDADESGVSAIQRLARRKSQQRRAPH